MVFYDYVSFVRHAIHGHRKRHQKKLVDSMRQGVIKAKRESGHKVFSLESDQKFSKKVGIFQEMVFL